MRWCVIRLTIIWLSCTEERFLPIITIIKFFFCSSTTVRCGLWLPIQFSSIPDGPTHPSGWHFNCIVFSTNLFLWNWDVNPMYNPQPRGSRCLSSSGTSLLTCLAWETLPVATLPPA
jgi:hypothetical protein